MLREGIVLTGAFVANIDAEMAVGGVEETITVTGATPEVDVVSVRQQSVVTQNQLHVLPGLSNVLSGARYVPGVTNAASCCNLNGLIYGSDNADSQPYLDGIKSGKGLGGRNDFNGGINQGSSEAAIQELIYDTSSQGAEYPNSGVRSNLIPKAGGNVFSGEIYLKGGHQRFQSSNLSAALEARGFKFAPVAWNWTLNPGIGGPIVEDKLWFFGTFTHGRSKRYHLGLFFDPNDPTSPEGLGEDQACLSGRIQLPAAGARHAPAHPAQQDDALLRHAPALLQPGHPRGTTLQDPIGGAPLGRQQPGVPVYRPLDGAADEPTGAGSGRFVRAHDPAHRPA